MQGRGTVKPPIGITFDCDFGTDIDSVLTLGFLQAASNKGDGRLISVSVSKSTLRAAQAAEAIKKFYEGPPAPRGPVGSPVGGNPEMIGLADNGKWANDTPIINTVLKNAADGKPAYPFLLKSLLDTAEPDLTMRNILLAQFDENAVAVLDGPATDMVRLMNLYGARPQLTAKVKVLVAAIGAYPNGAPEAGVRADIASAKKLFAEWPTPIIAVGSEVGESLPYPASSIEKDFAWSTAHPVVDAYKAFKPMPYDAPVPGMAAALYATHPDDGYFKLSEPGTITVTDDGRTRFTPGPGGKHRYLIADPAQKEKITKLYVDLIATKPVAPVFAGRGRGGRGASGFGGRGASGGRGVIAPAAPAPVDNIPPPPPLLKD
jgi:hypothetical protein